MLELRGITKRFGDFVANDRIDLDVRAGEVHALLGENGAGKSTLMNCLYGLYRPDEGEILLEGQVQHFTSSADAIGAGIGMVHQHFMLADNLTVLENVVLGAERMYGIGRKAKARVRELAGATGLDIDPDTLVERLGDAGRRLHTGRSRNEQVSLDLRLYLRRRIPLLQRAVAGVVDALATQAGLHVDWHPTARLLVANPEAVDGVGLVVVVSAMGDTTDELPALAAAITAVALDRARASRRTASTTG